MALSQLWNSAESSATFPQPPLRHPSGKRQAPSNQLQKPSHHTATPRREIHPPYLASRCPWVRSLAHRCGTSNGDKSTFWILKSSPPARSPQRAALVCSPAAHVPDRFLTSRCALHRTNAATGSRLCSAVRLSHRLHGRRSPITMVTVPGASEAPFPLRHGNGCGGSAAPAQTQHSVVSLFGPHNVYNHKICKCSFSKTHFFPLIQVVFCKEKKRIKLRLMSLPEFLPVFRGKKQKKTTQKPLNCGSKALNPT